MAQQTTSKYDYVAGVDPDVDKSGVAFLDVREKCIVKVGNLPFPELIESLLYSTMNLGDKRMAIVIEASYITTTNWHTSRYETIRTAAKKGYAVGRNHETARKLVEMLRHQHLRNVDIIEQPPLRKSWSGNDRKITQDEIMQFVPNLPRRMNQDARDATLLAWSFANLPIRLKAHSANSKTL